MFQGFAHHSKTLDRDLLGMESPHGKIAIALTVLCPETSELWKLEGVGMHDAWAELLNLVNKQLSGLSQYAMFRSWDSESRLRR